MTLLWAILNPGNDGLEELGVDDGTSLTGVVATALLVMYQLMSVIILLNLLIAVMNATIQKTQQRYSSITNLDYCKYGINGHSTFTFTY